MSIVATGLSKGKGVPLRPGRGQTRISCPYKVVTGVDKLEVSLYLTIARPELFEMLSLKKAEVQQGMKPSIAVSFPCDEGSERLFRWNLKRTGTRLHPYCLRSGDITLMLSNRSHLSPIPNCQVEIGSLSSQQGVFDIFRRLVAWLNVYGFKVDSEVLGRTDLAADFLGVQFRDLGVQDEDRWITRGRDFNTYSKYRKMTGIHLGSSRLMCRVYDKTTELQRNKQKRKFFYDHWQCPEGTPVTRVEFQLRRAVLKDFNLKVDTVAELEKNLDSLWQYLTQDWARFADKAVDRENKNHKQAPLSPFWKKVQDAVFTTRTLKNWRTIKKTVHKNLQLLKDQARGCLLNFAAAAGHEPDDFNGIVRTCVDVFTEDLRHYMKERYLDYYKLFNVRRNECFVGI